VRVGDEAVVGIDLHIAAAREVRIVAQPLDMLAAQDGRRDKRTVLMELLRALDESDRQLPLYRLLTRIADESEDIRYRDALSIACLPYLLTGWSRTWS
jgi:hypothetical protein